MPKYMKVEEIYTNISYAKATVTLAKIINKSNYIDVDGVVPSPEVGWYYDSNLDQWSEDLPSAYIAETRLMFPREFWFGRITPNERGIIFALAQEDGGGVVLTLVQRGRLKAFLEFTMSNDISLDHYETVFILNALETVGAIGVGRAAEILT